MALQDDFNEVVSDINTLGYKINVLLELWTLLNTQQKDIIKNQAVTILTTAKTNIDGVITQIQAL